MMQTQPLSPAAPQGAQRLVSLDAYRGFVMLAMVSGGLGLERAAEFFRDGTWANVWQWIGYEFSHAPWTGCAAWDLIQPSFMFIVGVAMPYSYAARQARGDSPASTWRHVLFRAAFLTLLGVFLRSNGRPQTNFTFEDVSSQLGLGYLFVFLLLGRSWRVQAAIAALIAVGYWLLFAVWPVPPAEFDAAAQYIPADWSQFTGFAAHWNKHLNPAGYFDQWLLNIFPRPEPFYANSGGYQTLNFIPSMVTTIFGVLAGQFLLGPASLGKKVSRLLLCGAACLAFGLAVDGNLWPGQGWDWSVAPVVKRIWTPSWAVFSTGWTLWSLALFIVLVDVLGMRRAAFPLIVVGMNSIAAYVLSWLFRPWVIGTLKTHLGQQVFDGPYGSIAASLCGVAAVWLVCYWMYRRGIFLRV